ncbi:MULTISPECIES: helix-turn-helix transcriptional regulator [unclassified Frankia]|uniref:helix-turn-helix domain-containing protein n=1 Tax=unclassified Frankia TaxID=2632575 RepID=UPI002AD43FEF|nr:MULTISPECIES: helix-turn-helix transcriptional regulator [unclassified Frankia]
MAEQSLGDRLAQVRRRRSLTQEELAQAAGVSVATIFKLEQGQRTSARVSTLHALARALGVTTSELFGPGAELDPDTNGDTASLVALRRILAPAPGAPSSVDDLPTLDDLKASITAVGRTGLHCRYTDTLAELPPLISSAQAAADHYQGQDGLGAQHLLARAYLTTGTVLAQFRHEDLAYDAIVRAITAAQQAGDPILHASGIYHLGWIFIRQGRFDDAEDVTVRAAEAIEPSISRSSPAHIAIWGRLLVEASAAAARNNRAAASRDLLTLARSAAARLAHDRFDYDQHWSSFGPTTVAAIEVENAMTTGDADHAVHLARNVPASDHIQLVTRMRHLLTVAEASVATRNYETSVKTLQTVRDAAPEWLKNQRLARHVVRDLLDATSIRRAKNVGLAELADYIGVRP